MTALVQESLRLRKRAARWQGLMMGGGTLLGLALGLGLGSRPSFAGSGVGAGVLCALFGLLCTWLPTQAYAPETRQQGFLDHYRQVGPRQDTAPLVAAVRRWCPPGGAPRDES